MPISIPGRSASPKKRDRGVTLIELLVAMAIVGAIFAAAATGLRSALGVNLKNSASRLASTLRYLSNKAVTDHRYLRVVFDLEGQSYHVEESQDPFVISPEEELAEEKEEKKEEEAEQPSGFTPSESRLLKPTKLPSDVFFKDVYVSYLNQKKENGKAYTYFFPDGFATATLINLRDDDDEEHFAVEVLSLSGQVKVFGEYRESPTEEKK